MLKAKFVHEVKEGIHQNLILCLNMLQIQNRPQGWQEKLVELTKGDKDRPMVAYCVSGARAQGAVIAMGEEGYTNTRNAGGLSGQEQLLEELCTTCKDGNMVDTSTVIDALDKYTPVWKHWWLWVAVIGGVIMIASLLTLTYIKRQREHKRKQNLVIA